MTPLAFDPSAVRPGGRPMIAPRRAPGPPVWSPEMAFKEFAPLREKGKDYDRPKPNGDRLEQDAGKVNPRITGYERAASSKTVNSDAEQPAASRGSDYEPGSNQESVTPEKFHRPALRRSVTSTSRQAGAPPHPANPRRPSRDDRVSAEAFCKSAHGFTEDQHWLDLAEIVRQICALDTEFAALRLIPMQGLQSRSRDWGLKTLFNVGREAFHRLNPSNQYLVKQLHMLIRKLCIKKEK